MSLRIFMASSCWISSLQDSPGWCCCWMRSASVSECHRPDACSTNRKLWKISRDNSHWNGIYIKSPNGVERSGGLEWSFTISSTGCWGKWKLNCSIGTAGTLMEKHCAPIKYVLPNNRVYPYFNIRAELYKKKFKDFTCAHVMLNIYMSYSDTAWLNKTFCQ